MKLSVKDRFLVLGLLPKEGSRDTIRIIHDLKQSLSFSEEEHAKFAFQQNGDIINWSNDEETEIEIGPKGMGIVADALKAIDAKGKFNEDLIPVWDKFIPPE